MEAINQRHVARETETLQEERARHPVRNAGGFLFWFLGLAVLVIAAWFVHGHPNPWPFELTISRDVQAWHMPGLLRAILIFVSTFNDPTPSGIAAAVVVAALLFTRKIRQALFLGYLILVGDSFDAIIGDIVGRPRPSPHLIHVTATLNFNSFPSGHTEHIVIFYGFLLFLSLTKPVRQWKYAKWLIPIQVLMALDILLMGFSRVLEGEHWPLDVLGGYLSGALWLSLFIYLYARKWTRNESGAWQRGKAQEKAGAIST